METAALLIMLLRWWLYAGAAVAIVFLSWGIDRIDENARGSYLFRPLLIPGIMLIWPLVCWRWLTLERQADHWPDRYRAPRAAHGRVWLVLSVLIPAIFFGALAVRQTWPGNAPAVQLAPPEGDGGQ